MHPEAHAGLDRMLADAGIDRDLPWRALDLGGADINGTGRDLLPAAKWTGLDIHPGPGVDVVADATTWTPPPGAEWDIVVCTELLEHVDRWPAVVTTAACALVNAGYLFVTCAATGRRPHGARGEPYPAPNEYYGNIDPTELLLHLGTHFRDLHVDYNPNPGDVYAWGVK